MHELVFYSNVVGSRVRHDAAAALVNVAPAPLAKCFFVNSGAEANENAAKLARQITGRDAIVAFEGGFHGRSLGALSMTGIKKYRDLAKPHVPGHHFATFGDLASVESLLAAHAVAAVILEPVQSMAGCRTADAAFFRGLRALCDQYGALLIYDEVQTGFGRTGTFFFAGRHGVVPDVVTLGKGIASGIPMAALLTTDAVAARVGYGDLGTTFGGGQLACAAMRETIAIIEDEGLLAHVEMQSQYLEQGLSDIPGVVAVHGLGFLLGVRLSVAASAVQQKLFACGILTGTSEDPMVLRLLPPLTLSRAEIDLFLSQLAAVLDLLGANKDPPWPQ
jgi:acetylornithine/succinyldiaminopimelate/putrescine aminotransferase